MTSFSFLRKISQSQWLNIYLLAAFLIACKIMYNQHGWVNNDSLLYFEQARLIAAGQLQQAFGLFTWILYPGLLAIIHKLTGLSIHVSAISLNVLCFVIFVAGFQRLLIEAGAKLRTLHWGMLLLFSTQYIVGDVLGMLLRDEGFWAAYTWGLLFWLRALKSQHWKHILQFQAVMAVAVLFRIESSAYLLALPLCALLLPQLTWLQRLKLWLKANSLALLTTVIVAIGLLAGVLQQEQLGRLQEVFTQIAHLFTERITFINQKAAILGHQVLGEDLDQYGTFSLWSSLVLIAIFKTLKVAGLPALAVILWPRQTWWSKLPEVTRYLVISTLTISFVVSLVIIFNVFILSSRYVIASGIVMLLLAAFAITEWQQRWPKWVSKSYVLLLAVLFMYSLFDKHEIDLDRVAVDYIAQINPQHKPAFYDTENARFYADQPYTDRILGRVAFPQLVNKNEIDQYDYFMITISKDPADIAYERQALQVLGEHQYKLVNTLYGWRNKTKALIFVRHPENKPN
ncbi:MAG TPA: hypothetical protein VNZ84_06205 [Methylophilus sp.]|nr:hypothetical protein [Methylophilus sp.]